VSLDCDDDRWVGIVFTILVVLVVLLLILNQ
jgi:hypothetical protein